MTLSAAGGQFDDFNRFHDWLHITNISPDGRFVNLWNLAPVINGQRVSGIDAKSSITLSGTTGNPAAPFINGNSQVVSELSYDLSLYDGNGVPTNTLSSGGTADPNIPAHWSYRQQWMFRPSTGPMFSTSSSAGSHLPNSPGDSWYAPYQYCDADGDGMFDSRWIELVDASEPNNPLSLLPRDDRFRWFVAVRVMDLSGLVNVNTASDFKEPAQKTGTTEVTKFGATPADIDLRRLFTMDEIKNIRQNAAKIRSAYKPPGQQ